MKLLFYLDSGSPTFANQLHNGLFIDLHDLCVCFREISKTVAFGITVPD